MTKTIEAVYEEGVLKLLQDPGLREHQHVVVQLRPTSSVAADGEDRLRAWQQVYEGLSDSEIDEVEAIALDRSSR